MTLEEAIKTAIQFEKKIHAVYLDAAGRAGEPSARRMFEVMGQEELGHVAYLESRLGEWQKSGSLNLVALDSVVPAQDLIRSGLNRMLGRVAAHPPAHETEVALLRQALLAEGETAAFYRRMVAELDAEGRNMFARFLEIEDGHAIIVQAEIDALTQLGFCFDVQEFALEAG